VDLINYPAGNKGELLGFSKNIVNGIRKRCCRNKSGWKSEKSKIQILIRSKVRQKNWFGIISRVTNRQFHSFCEAENLHLLKIKGKTNLLLKVGENPNNLSTQLLLKYYYNVHVTNPLLSNFSIIM